MSILPTKYSSGHRMSRACLKYLTKEDNDKNVTVPVELTLYTSDLKKRKCISWLMVTAKDWSTGRVVCPSFMSCSSVGNRIKQSAVSNLNGNPMFKKSLNLKFMFKTIEVHIIQSFWCAVPSTAFSIIISSWCPSAALKVVNPHLSGLEKLIVMSDVYLRQIDPRL